MTAPIHTQPEIMYRTHRIKKRRSWISFILTFIAMVLTAIAAYSMYRETLFTIGFLNQDVYYDQFKTFTEQLTRQTLVDLSEIEQRLNYLRIALRCFFVLCLINIILALLTLLFNRTLLKLINWIISVCITFIPIGFLYIIREVAEQLSDKLAPVQALIGTVDPNTIITASSALYNAAILTGIATVLYFIALFFRNRKSKLHESS
ncbi:hypothetical protein [Staphylococcus sp. 17KM0847]|uniref:hypothetical protein n=1 Tax=Staphylococcus sp. 17KM0847 TaxID=2583989 RepID=UPI0015DD407E|nr:hypothetical protein [Staphylococcus sp. 17KM0847]QLK86714.1 hypothetical protein FGL66_08435 [Staphylococcus sp. 17KM0847]